MMPRPLTRSPNDPAGGEAGKVDPAKPDPAKGDEITKALEAATARTLELEARLAKSEAAERKRAEDEAKKRGEYETLYATTKAELDAKAARLAELEAAATERQKAMDKRNKERVKEIPESRRTLVPEGLAPEALAAYLDANWTHLKGPDPDGGTVRNTGGASGELSDDDVRRAHPNIAADAERRGLSPAHWFGILKKTNVIKPAQA